METAFQYSVFFNILCRVNKCLRSCIHLFYAKLVQVKDFQFVYESSSLSVLRKTARLIWSSSLSQSISLSVSIYEMHFADIVVVDFCCVISEFFLLLIF